MAESNAKRERYQKLVASLSEQLHRVDNGMPHSIMHQLDKLSTKVDTWLSSAESRSQHKHKKQKVKKWGLSHLVAKEVFTLLVGFLHNDEGENKFWQRYIQDGNRGFLQFRAEIEEIAKRVIASKGLPMDEQEVALEQLQKKNGFIDNMIVNLHDQVWLTTERFVKETNAAEWESLAGNVGFHSHKITLLKEWSKHFLHARDDGAIRIGGQLSVEEQIQHWNKKKNVRPSRAIYGQRMLAFIEDAQLHKITDGHVGKGVEGKVGLCTITYVPFIPPMATLCFKEFIAKTIDDNRQSAVTEATLRGVNHKGIIAALAMTTTDPPLLIFDYYNGGTIAKMLKKVGGSAWPNLTRLEETSLAMDSKEIKAFMKARLGICFAILETIDFLHENSRLHNDLHLSNIVLHFDYDTDRGRDDAEVKKVSVDIIDWGQGLYFSQLPHGPRLAGTEKINRAQAMIDYPHLAPELLRKSPPPYSPATEMFAVGNAMESLLLNKDGWERGKLEEQILCEGWERAFHSCLMVMVTTMKSHRPSDRKDCEYWKKWMMKSFPGCGLHFGSSQFLRE